MNPDIIHKQYTERSGAVPAPIEGTGLFASSPTGAWTTPLQNRQRWLTIATNAIDRAGDILVIEGMDAENFLRNPQFLWQHGASGAQLSTIGKIVELRAQGNALYALAEYATADISPLAEQVYRMDLAGLLPANSIGFCPIEYEANKFGGYTFTQWELIECSKVELPMNPEAVDSFPIGRPQDAPTLDDATDWLLS